MARMFYVTAQYFCNDFSVDMKSFMVAADSFANAVEKIEKSANNYFEDASGIVTIEKIMEIDCFYEITKVENNSYCEEITLEKADIYLSKIHGNKCTRGLL